MLTILVLTLGLGAGLASAGERSRVDLYDTTGRRTGYAIIDRPTGRVDHYDAQSRRTSCAQVDAFGRVELFGLDGKRQVPMPPHPAPRRQ